MIPLSRCWFRLLRFSLCLFLGVILVIVPTISHSHPPTIATARIAQINPHGLDSLLDEGRQAYAAQRYRDAIAAWSQVLEQQQIPPQLQVLTLSYLTAAYQQLGQWQVADRHITQSLDQLAALPDAPTMLRGQVYNTLGSLQFAQGQTQLALENWQIASEFYAQSGNESRYLSNLLNQVQAQQSLGYYQQAQTSLVTLEQRLPQQSLELQIRGYLKLGQTYRLLGDLTKSQERLQMALNLAQQAHSPDDHLLLELGNTKQAQGDWEGAIAFYQQAEHSNDANIRLKARLNRLKTLVQHNDLEAARKAASTLPTEIATLPPGRSQVYAYINAAQSLLQIKTPGEIESAARMLAQAIQNSLELQDTRAETYARGYLGRAYEISHQWPEAQQLTTQALVLAQSTNAADITYQWQWQLGRLLKQQGKRDLALQAYRNAFATLQSLKQDLVTVSDDLQFSFRDRVEPVYRELVDLLLQPDSSFQLGQTKTVPWSVAISNRLKHHPTSPPPHRPTSHRQDVFRSTENRHNQPRLTEARAVIEALKIAEFNNFFRTACLEAQQVNLEEINRTTAAVIYPIILPNRLEIIASLPGQPLQQYTSTVAQADLEQTLLDWRQNLEKPFTAPEGKALGQQLYRWIMGPMGTALAEAHSQTLVFVLDGALRNAPMAALYDGEQYLVENHEIVLSPGLQLLGPRPLQATHVSALLGGLTEPRHGFSALFNVADEIQAIQALFDSRVLINERFTTTALAQQIIDSELPIVHLATHAQYSSNLEDTFILAWDRPIPVNELNHLLRRGNQSRLEPIELLTLSACETATGSSQAALGLAGISLQAGARSTLASLWNLDDAAGAYFVNQFYQALTQPHTTKAAALRQAQRSLLSHHNYRHPIYWSAYVLVGNWL
jgi:CHAT domain-containing protein